MTKFIFKAHHLLFSKCHPKPIEFFYLFFWGAIIYILLWLAF